jgi:hypothetical protein
MTTTVPTTITTTTAPAGSRTDRRARVALGALAVGYPLWAVVSLTQAATREGFDILRHPLSALSTGDLGWLQIANFVVAGIAGIVGAGGLRRALRGTPGATWAPRLVGLSGLGLVAAGMLVMDPGGGFPVGAPEGMPALSWHAVGHMVAGTISFAALVAACLVLGRHFSRAGRRGLAVASRAAGLALVLGDGWAMSGAPAGTLTLAVGAISAMVWLAAVAAMLRRDV